MTNPKLLKVLGAFWWHGRVAISNHHKATTATYVARWGSCKQSNENDTYNSGTEHICLYCLPTVILNSAPYCTTYCTPYCTPMYRTPVPYPRTVPPYRTPVPYPRTIYHVPCTISMYHVPHLPLIILFCQKSGLAADLVHRVQGA